MKTVKDIGEFGIISRIQRKIKEHRDVVKGIGDDSAVIRPAKGLELVTTDSVVDGVDFHWEKTHPALVGRKLAGINLSDIAAMGGRPRYALLVLGLFPGLRVTWLDGFLNGLVRLLRRFRVHLIGGDISRSDIFWASLTLLGEAPKNAWISRAGARPGDHIFVTGSLGGSILSKHLTFLPRIREAHEIVRRFHPSSMIDISDGFFQDLGHILDASKAGANVYASSIPISAASRKLSRKDKLSPLDHALGDGEDFELVFTVRPGLAGRVPSKLLGTRITRVGVILGPGKGLNLLVSPGNPQKINVTKKGYTHF